jgi:hypothetical protein
VNNFKKQYGCYPPSRIRLRANWSDYNPADPLDVESQQYIVRIWERLGPFTNYKWNGVSPPPSGGAILEGDQCLVFFLGGPGGTQGFSTNPQDPCGKYKDSKGNWIPQLTFYEFKTARLRPDPINAARSPAGHVPTGFPSYLSNWADLNEASPRGYYAYFSSGRSKNGYNSNGTISHEIAALDNVGPYYDTYVQDPVTRNYTITNYLNPSTFQIISPGQDGFFTNYNPVPNPNTHNLPVLASLAYPMSSPKIVPQRCYWKDGVSGESTNYWKDNRANFSGNQLQVP